MAFLSRSKYPNIMAAVTVHSDFRAQDNKFCHYFHFSLSSIKFSHSVVSDSLWPHELQHTRLPCPSPTPRAWSNSCPSSQWCHLILCCTLLLLPSTFPNIRVFSNELVLHSASVLPMNIQDRFHWGLTGLISLQSKGLSRVFSNTTFQNHQFFFSGPTLTSIIDYWKNLVLTRRTFVGKVMSLLFNMLLRFVIDFPQMSKHLSISWLQSSSAVILEPKNIVSQCFHFLFAMKCWNWMPWS